jgi:predicted  nucleic acid-binding Zn-ribbon protein
MNQITRFIRLQQIDSRVDYVILRLEQIRLLLEDDHALRQLFAQQKEFEQRLILKRKDQEMYELAVQEQQIKIQQIEANLYGGKIQNPKELQEIQTEIVSLKKQLSSLENKLLEVMMIVDDGQVEYQVLCEKVDATQDEFKQKNSIILTEQERLIKELENLRAEKKAAENSIPLPDLMLYNRLRLSRGGIAVSTISEGACNSCGATLTPAQEQKVKSSEQKVYCPSCGRILFAS